MAPKKIVEVIWGTGHANIQAVHPTTLMFTKEKHLSENGDCIIAVAADKASADLSAEFKDALRQPNVKVNIIIEADGLRERVNAYGSPNLALSHATDIVVRRSEFTSDRTIAVKADKSSKDLAREFIDKLRDPNRKIKITLTARIS